MASLSQLQKLQALIWVLIFGGLLSVVYGLAIKPYEWHAAVLLIIGGALAAALGAVLILVRARMKPDDTDPKKPN